MDALRRESLITWAAWICFAAGSVGGGIALWGVPRPIVGDESFSAPAAAVTAIVAATAFIISTLVHRRAETRPMPSWQAAVSNVSAVALALAFAALGLLGVLTAGEVLQAALQGYEVPTIAGAIVTGCAAAAGGAQAFAAGIRLTTRDLASLLIAFLVTGTVFAMLTAADPRWWELHFSQLGAAGGWAFNGTLVIAGLLVATVGSYVGRDLHRLLGDVALPRIAWAVGAFVLAGVAFAGIGLVPVDRARLAHDVVAVVALALLVLAAVLTTITVPRAPASLRVTTLLLGGALVAAVLLRWVDVLNLTAMEAVVAGIVIVWLTTLVRTLAALDTDTSRPSAVRTLAGIGRDSVGSATL